MKFLFQTKSEIRELLLIIYPTKSGKAWKTVTNDNCYFLLKLAGEYHMEDIRKKCEDVLVKYDVSIYEIIHIFHFHVLVKLVPKKPGTTFLDDLTFAQTYKLETLLGKIINKDRQLRLQDFKSHEMYHKMDPDI